jgi:Transposase IS66 family
LQIRQDIAVPILRTFRAWLDEQRPKALPKSPMGEAICYALNNWTALVRLKQIARPLDSGGVSPGPALQADPEVCPADHGAVSTATMHDAASPS